MAGPAEVAEPHIEVPFPFALEFRSRFAERQGPHRFVQVPVECEVRQPLLDRLVSGGPGRPNRLVGMNSGHEAANPVSIANQVDGLIERSEGVGIGSVGRFGDGAGDELVGFGDSGVDDLKGFRWREARIVSKHGDSC